MHRFPNRSAILRLQICALFFVLSYTVLFSSFVALIVFMVTAAETRLFYFALFGLGAGAILVFVQWALSLKTYCPLCRMPMMERKRCIRHRKAVRLFGSYRLPVVKGVIFKGKVRCPYCNEPSELAVRDRTRPRRSYNEM